MGEIRFVGTGETRGYPYLVCKKCNVSLLYRYMLYMYCQSVLFVVYVMSYFYSCHISVFYWSNNDCNDTRVARDCKWSPICFK